VIGVECYLDEFLVSQIGVPRKEVKHQRGKGKVLEFIIKNEGAVGLIDEDPGSRQPSSLSSFVEADRIGSARLMIHKTNSRCRLVQLSPDLEGWLIGRANALKLDLGEYGLPCDVRQMHDVQHLEKNSHFRNFLAELEKRDPDFSKLRDWMTGHG
jgi:hypothetical protein